MHKWRGWTSCWVNTARSHLTLWLARTTVVPITLTRTYSGNNTVANQCGIIILSLVAALPSTTTFNWWTSTFTGPRPPSQVSRSG